MPNPMIRERGGDGAEYVAPLAQLECVVERITFHNEENGYAVLKVTMPDAKGGKEDRGRTNDDVITVLGNFSNPTVGESLRCHGTWVKHPQYGSQFKCERYETLRPATAAAIEKYLGSGMVKGIGKEMAKRIVAKFGDKALDVIEKTPQKLTKVSGIGEKRVELITSVWEEQREIRSIMQFLIGHGVTPTYAVKIFKFYKERAIEIVERNPFQLATDIWGIGFKSADKIAQNMGIAPDAPERLEAGLIYVLNDQMESRGHCYLPREELIKKACEILLPQTAPDGDEEADKTLVLRAAAIESALDFLIERGLLVSETMEMMGIHDTAIYTPSIHVTEKAVAENVNSILDSKRRGWFKSPTAAETREIVEGLRGYDTLSEEQQAAVRMAISEPILILTGGPGTGKCVGGDTLIHGEDGFRPISQHWGIAGGDISVWSDSTGRGEHYGKLMGEPDSFRDYELAVLGRTQRAKTSHAYYGGWRRTVRFTTRLGLKLEGTPNHRVWAKKPNGGEDWVRLDELAAGMQVAVRKGDEYWPDAEPNPSRGAMMGKHFAHDLQEKREFSFLSGLLRSDRETTIALLSALFDEFTPSGAESEGRLSGASGLSYVQSLLLNLGVTSRVVAGQNFDVLTVEDDDKPRFKAILAGEADQAKPEILWETIQILAEGFAEVYDLTVPGEESFVANGFVNHNTTTTKTIVAAFEKMGKRIQLASPTGRAAKRAAEVTGMEAKTIHRLLAFDPEKKGFKHGPGEPLELDVLIIDESSMLDLSLTHNTLRAVPNGAQVLFVGDVDQLPSVGPGNVLNDLIQSGRVPVARLTQVFRQAAQSKIITNAHAINRGKMPELPPPSEIKNGADCVFLEVEEPEDALQKIKGVVAKSLPNLGFRPEEITLLAPMQRGSLGARNLNEVLQAVLNPPAAHKTEHVRGPITFREGDRVMQRRNNYDKNVFNGDVGFIREIAKDDQKLWVEYPEQTIEYDLSETDELSHSLAISIHKAQGSEYQAAIIIFHNQHYMMLQRNLLYTGLTRAKKLAVFIGTSWAIKRAVANKHVQPRYTRLSPRLQSLVEDLGTRSRPASPTGSGTNGRNGNAPIMPGRLF